eukprot:11226907-Lingulodinium_polyedra.AAC.1
MARVGADDMLRRARAPRARVGSYYAELDDELAGAVERRWHPAARLGLEIPRARLVRDAWGSAAQWGCA